MKKSYAPFKDKKDFESAVIQWEEIRREGKINMLGMGQFWPKEEVRAVINAYNEGIAQKIIEKKMPKEE